jgi:diaminopimelate epimerase
VRVKMTDPHSYRDNITVKLGEGEHSVEFLDTGVPHAVIFIENETIPVDVWGREVRFHDLFQPQGTNVNFVKVVTERRIKVRTYERGVEAETMACGTGAVASALVTALHYGLQSPIEVITSGGEVLTIFFKMAEKHTASDVYLQGATHLIYSGSLTSEALL